MPPISRIYKGTELVYSAPDTQPLTAFLTNLQAGDRIQLFRAANIRTAATISTTTLKGVNPSGARGTVIAGPTTGVSNSTWYNINFDLGYDGWCVSDNYTQITTTTIQTTPNTFAVNDKIRLIRASNIRSTALIATTNLLGVNPTNTKGTILEGPTKTANINWYRINFDTGFDGWCASDNYVGEGVVGGPLPPIIPPNAGQWPDIAQQHVSTASGIALYGFKYTHPGWIGGLTSTGMVPEVLAYAAFKGNTSADSRLMAHSNNMLQPSTMPLPHGRTLSQMEMRAQAMWVIMRHTPRIWDPLPTTTKNKISTIMKGMLYVGAYMGSDSAPGNTLQLVGVDLPTRSIGTNISMGATAGKIMGGISFFGGPTAVNTLLKNFSITAFRAELASQFGTNSNMYRTFNWRKEGYTGPILGFAGLSTDAPTDAQIENAIRNFAFSGHPVTDIEGILMQRKGAFGQALENTVASGLNNGAGAAEDPTHTRGKIMKNAAGTPHLGTKNAHIWELDGQDGEGERSSMGYGTWTARVLIDTILMLEISSNLNKSDPQIADLLRRLAIALDVWQYFNQQGYYSWAHEGDKGGGGGSPATWVPGGPSNWYMAKDIALWNALRVRLGQPTSVR